MLVTTGGGERKENFASSCRPWILVPYAPDVPQTKGEGDNHHKETEDSRRRRSGLCETPSARLRPEATLGVPRSQSMCRVNLDEASHDTSADHVLGRNGASGAAASPQCHTLCIMPSMFGRLWQPGCRRRPSGASMWSVVGRGRSRCRNQSGTQRLLFSYNPTARVG